MESKGKIKIKEAGEGCNGWYDNGNKYLQSTYNESDERSDEWIRNAYRDDFDK